MITWLVLVLVARVLVVPLGVRLAPQAPPPFDFGRTMRVDYVHTGGPSSGETLALDRVVNDGAWAGSRTQFIDATNLGKYFFEVHDKASGRVIYSRGFASVFGEWETTAEVKTVHRSFHESMRFPWPTQPVRVTLQKRQPDNRFTAIWSTDVDPGSRFVNAAAPAAHAGTVWTVFENGPASEKVDLLVMSEGYTREQLPKFHKDAARLIDACSPRSRSRAASATSMSGHSTCRRPRAA
jgi:hypothetical protein